MSSYQPLQNEASLQHLIDVGTLGGDSLTYQGLIGHLEERKVTLLETNSSGCCTKIAKIVGAFFVGVGLGVGLGEIPSLVFGLAMPTQALQIGLGVGFAAGPAALGGITGAIIGGFIEFDETLQVRRNNQIVHEIDQLVDRVDLMTNRDEGVYRDLLSIFALCHPTILKEMNYKQIKKIRDTNPEVFSTYLNDGTLSDSQTIIWNRIEQIENSDGGEILEALESSFFSEQITQYPIIFVGLLQHMRKDLLDSESVVNTLILFARKHLLSENQQDLSDEMIKDELLLIANGQGGDVQELQEIIVDPITIQISGQTILANKQLLIKNSPVFKAMLEHDTLEKAENIISLKDVNVEYFKEVLSFLQSYKISINHVNVSHFLEIARRFQIKNLEKSCENYVLENIQSMKEEDCLFLADNYQLCRVKNIMREQISSKVEKLHPFSHDLVILFHKAEEYHLEECVEKILGKLRHSCSCFRDQIRDLKANEIPQIIKRIMDILKVYEGLDQELFKEEMTEYLHLWIDVDASLRLNKLWDAAVDSEQEFLKQVIAKYTLEEKNKAVVTKAWGLALPKELDTLRLER